MPYEQGRKSECNYNKQTESGHKRLRGHVIGKAMLNPIARIDLRQLLAAVYGGIGPAFDSNISERNHMPDSSANWSEQRRAMSPRIASVLYGVIAIMTVDIVVEVDRLKYAESTWDVLLIGLAMTITRIFIRVVTREAEIGAHLRMKEYGDRPCSHRHVIARLSRDANGRR